MLQLFFNHIFSRGWADLGGCGRGVRRHVAAGAGAHGAGEPLLLQEQGGRGQVEGGRDIQVSRDVDSFIIIYCSRLREYSCNLSSLGSVKRSQVSTFIPKLASSNLSPLALPTTYTEHRYYAARIPETDYLRFTILQIICIWLAKNVLNCKTGNTAAITFRGLREHKILGKKVNKKNERVQINLRSERLYFFQGLPGHSGGRVREGIQR